MIATIIIPTLNEEKFIANCLNSFIEETSLLDQIEIFIIDGGSEDSTLEIAQEFEKNYKQVRVLENKRKIQSCAMNLGIKHSNSKYILRLDAHAEYSGSYIDKSIDEIENAPEDVVNIGGYINTVSLLDTSFSEAISYALSSKIGVGNSTFRVEVPTQEVYVDTVPFGCFKRKELIEIGLYDESLQRGEDLELNNRFRNSRKKILLSPNIKSNYFSRNDLKSFIKQAFSNGFFITNTFGVKPDYHQLRHFIPFMFVTYLFLTILLFSLDNLLLLKNSAIGVLIIYFLLMLYHGISSTKKAKNIKCLLISPIVLLSLHLSYGIGSWAGFFNNLLKKH